MGATITLHRVTWVCQRQLGFLVCDSYTALMLFSNVFMVRHTGRSALTSAWCLCYSWWDWQV